ncbi:MAG: hypothetical protein V1793_24225 [Pseudomonadota bacterium]
MKMPLITPEMTVLDIVARWEKTQLVFKRYDTLAGECICCSSLFESLDHVANKYGFNLGILLEDLEEAAGSC